MAWVKSTVIRIRNVKNVFFGRHAGNWITDASLFGSVFVSSSIDLNQQKTSQLLHGSYMATAVSVKS